MKTSPSVSSCTVRVPATSANLGPGFDTMGVALRLYNTVRVKRNLEAVPLSGMVAETAERFFALAKHKPFAAEVSISGAVPPARGLGSSVTVRLGVAAGLNRLAGEPLVPEALLGLVIDLEGHPDNAVPAFHGGFATCAPGRYLRVAVAPRLKFVGLVPDFELETKKARTRLRISSTLPSSRRPLRAANMGGWKGFLRIVGTSPSGLR